MATSTIPARGDDLVAFTAPTPDGAQVGPRDFYLRRNLALAFTHGPDCPACRDLLRGLARAYGAARSEAGEILAVLPLDVPAADALRAALDLPFPVAADPEGDVARRYGLVREDGARRAALFVADRYGTIFEASVADAAHRMLGAEEVPGWLEFIACQCS